MEQAQMGLIVTLILGLFILLGALIAFLIKKREKVVDFSLGLAFGVISMLILTDLLPEVMEHLEGKTIFLAVLFTIIGILLSKLIDKFIPDHEEEHMNKLELNNNLIHIGVITSLTLALHNIIEGMAVYSTMLTSTSLGVGITLGVGFHNIPLGMVIAGTFYQSGENKYKIAINLILVSLSTFVGGLIMFFLNLEEISPLLEGILLSITLGMLLFISFDELLPRIKESNNKKVCCIGIIVGVIILLIASII